LHIKLLAKRLDAFGPKLFYGAIDVDTRKKQLKKFEKGNENLILANQVFTKGINVKRIDVVIDAAQKSSKNDAAQKYGRAARLHVEKAGIYYIDLYTEGKLEKAAKSRRGAFKKLKVPIKVLTMVECAFGAKGILRTADSLLTTALKNTKEKSAQGKLF
jgi:superfamily II DNA/RNA helicase